MSKKKDTGKKIQRYSLIVYSKNDLNMLLSENIKRYAYILHDRDIKNINRKRYSYKILKQLSKIKLCTYRLLKKAHYHLFISFVSPRRYKWLDTWKLTNKTEENIMCEPVKDFDALMLYFLHRNDLKEHQYNLSDIQSNFEIYDVDNNESVEHLDTFEKIHSIVNKKYSWFDLFKNNPKLIFSSGSLKTVYNLLNDEQNHINYENMLNKNEEIIKKQNQLVVDIENLIKKGK